MTNRNAEPSFDGHNDRITIDGRPLPFQSGVLPEDFADRLHRLKEASGLTWSGFALAIGVDRKQVRRWRRKGVEPSGGPMHSLFRFSARMPGGLQILLGESFQMTLWDEEDEEDEEETEA